MDLKIAVKSFQFAERAKSELIISSQLTAALPDFPDLERAGGRRMLIMLLESVRAELEFAFRDTEKGEFRKAIGLLCEAISQIESTQYGSASLKLSESISAATTAAQEAWQVLSDNGLL
jgi:hypothetical protein